MSKNIKYMDNIIEAIRLYAPAHPLLNCLDREGFAYKHPQYIPTIMKDGTICLVKPQVSNHFFRGERKYRASCRSGLSRITDRSRKILELLKTYHFMCYLRQNPNVVLWTAQNLHLDYWMMAQHYEFVTPLLDLTDEIATAAFFATHRYDRTIRNYVIADEGEGVIRHITGNLTEDGALRIVGQQPLGRPSQQDGVALWLDADEDFALKSDCVVFKQNHEINLRLSRAMLGGTDYFPPEEAAIMASTIRESDMIPNDAIEAMLNDVSAGKEYISPAVTRDEIKRIVSDYKYHIVDTDIVASGMLPPNPQLYVPRHVITRPAWR